jgi:hypothetical protein
MQIQNICWFHIVFLKHGTKDFICKSGHVFKQTGGSFLKKYIQL